MYNFLLALVLRGKLHKGRLISWANLKNPKTKASDVLIATFVLASYETKTRKILIIFYKATIIPDKSKSHPFINNPLWFVFLTLPTSSRGSKIIYSFFSYVRHKSVADVHIKLKKYSTWWFTKKFNRMTSTLHDLTVSCVKLTKYMIIVFIMNS